MSDAAELEADDDAAPSLAERLNNALRLLAAEDNPTNQQVLGAVTDAAQSVLTGIVEAHTLALTGHL